MMTVDHVIALQTNAGRLILMTRYHFLSTKLYSVIISIYIQYTVAWMLQYCLLITGVLDSVKNTV